MIYKSFRNVVNPNSLANPKVESLWVLSHLLEDLKIISISRINMSLFDIHKFVQRHKDKYE